MSPSQIATYLECEVKWDYAYAKKLKPYGPDWIHFAKGSYIHECMHYLYTLLDSGFDIHDPILVVSLQEKIKQDLQEAIVNLKEGEEIDFKFFDDCSRTVVNYVQFRSPVIDSHIQQLKVETHLEHIWDDRLFHGYGDLIYWDSQTNCWVVRDHKSGARNTYNLRSVFRNMQLKTYGTLFWIQTGLVAEVEINFIHSNPPRNPGKTVIYDLVRVKHTEETYRQHWNWMLEIHERQKNAIPLHNYNACGNCAYFPICNSHLRGLSSDAIVRSRYEQSSRQIHPKNSLEVSEVTEGFTPNFGG